MKKIIEKSAKGAKGFLIYNYDGELCFRIYTLKDKKKFIDYDIAHYDLEIIIDDDFASFYNKKGSSTGILDYSSKVLGRFKTKGK